MNMPTVDIKPFFEDESCTFSYVVSDPVTRAAALIDPVLGYDAASGRTNHDAVEEAIQFIRDSDLELQWILETHAHADHLSAAPYVQQVLGGRIAIGEGIQKVQANFKTVFDFEPDFPTDGSQFDHLFADEERFELGSQTCRIMATPGHTSDSITYLIGEYAFIGDTLFMPDYGSARTDFPGGCAEQLYQSIQKIYALPDDTILCMCHDYMPGGREAMWQTTVADQKARNVHASADVSQDKFVKQRTNRDAFLAVPKLMIPAVQVNIRAGHLPPASANGIAYLKVPLNLIGSKKEEKT